MKTQQEVESMLEVFETELTDLKNWAKKAEENYREDKEMWGGKADDGEWRYANDCLREVSNNVRMLKWVLSKEGGEQ